MKLAEKGFTLFEVLAATALAGIALVVILQLFSADLRALAASDDYVRASAKADEKLREIISGDLGIRTWAETTDDGHRIDCSVSPVLAERTAGLTAGLYEIVLTLHWTSGSKERAISLRTMKTAGRNQ